MRCEERSSISCRGSAEYSRWRGGGSWRGGETEGDSMRGEGAADWETADPGPGVP